MICSDLQRRRNRILIRLWKKSAGDKRVATGCGISSRRSVALDSAVYPAYYGIRNLKEAEDFLKDSYLGGNLRKICQALLELDTDNPHQVFGSPDDLKLLSSMTLFEKAEGKPGYLPK